MINLNTIRALLTEARTSEALAQLAAWAQTQSPVWQQAALLLQASWANNEQQATRGLVGYEAAEQVRNRITAGALNLIAEIESGATAPKAVLEDLQKQFLHEPAAANIQGENVTNLKGNNIHVHGNQDVVIGSGNVITKKTGIGRWQFWGILIGLAILLVCGYLTFDMLQEKQEATYVSLQEIRAELKMRGELDATVRDRINNNQSVIERWLTTGMTALRQKEFPKAVENLEKVAAEAPLATVHQNLAYAYDKLGQDDKAQENLNEAQKINPNLKRSQSGHVSFNLGGVWNSPEWGTMILVQNGNKITGTYEHDRGQIEGTIQDDRMQFRWWELVDKGKPYQSALKTERGDGYFILSADSKSINGLWRYEGDPDWKSKWTAVKK